ncbi:MAG: CapA family protein [Patescibacteria group bacterium]|nr:CapA family protein [Patescibacteria group bacterium]
MFELPDNQKHTKWKILAIVSIALFLCGLAGASIWYFLFYLSPVENKDFVENVEVPIVVETKKSEIKKEEKIVTPEFSSTTIIMVGDIMLDRDVFDFIKKNNSDFDFPFAKIKTFLADADFRVGNLEGPITNNKSIIKAGDASDNGGNLRFTFSPSTTLPLSQNFDLLSLANNHITNFANDGVVQTKNYLTKAGINYFGDFYNQTELSFIYEVATDLKIAFVGFHQFYPGGLNNVLSEITKIKSEKLADVIIIFPHWGTEYLTTRPDGKQQELSSKFIDAGADLVVGSHPHVIEPIEMYKDKIIFYSLGNFIFDQYFSPETMQGLALKLNFIRKENKIEAKINLIPLAISRETQVSVMEDSSKKQKVLDSLAENANVIDSVEDQIRKGEINFTF